MSTGRRRRVKNTAPGDALAPVAAELRSLLATGELDGRTAPDFPPELDLATATRIALTDFEDLRHLAATRAVPEARWGGVLRDLAYLRDSARAEAKPAHPRA